MSDGERNFVPHPGDGWAQQSAESETVCCRCGAQIQAGELVVASGCSEDPLVWICRRHSNISADREASS